MDLMKVGKARSFLIESGKIKETLIDAFDKGGATNAMGKLLLSMQEIANFCERDEAEIVLIREITSSLLGNIKPTPRDIREVLDILSECQSDLKNFIVEKMRLSAPKSEKFYEYYSAISKYAKMKEESTKERKKELILQQIFQTPGLYVTLLSNGLRKQQFGEEFGFSVSSVWQYVNELSNEKKIITVGGPQGRYRYCFPHPSMIKDRTKYYHEIFPYEGIVQEKVTYKFIQTKVKRFKDIFVVNGVERPILLIVDFGKLHNIEKNMIKGYGDLESFGYLKNEGFTPLDKEFSMDILRARKVARMINGHEEELWFDKEMANLFSHS